MQAGYEKFPKLAHFGRVSPNPSFEFVAGLHIRQNVVPMHTVRFDLVSYTAM
jgi:hypothetical protein